MHDLQEHGYDKCGWSIPQLSNTLLNVVMFDDVQSAASRMLNRRACGAANVESFTVAALHCQRKTRRRGGMLDDTQSSKPHLESRKDPQRIASVEWITNRQPDNGSTYLDMRAPGSA